MTEPIINFEEKKRPIWLLDRKTAFFMINSIQKGTCGGGWYYEECPKCGASYLEDIGHKCTDTIRIKCDMPPLEEPEIQSNLIKFRKRGESDDR